MVDAIQIGDKSFTPDEIAVLAKAGVLNVGEKHDVSSTTPNATPMVGPFPGNNAQFGPFGVTGNVARPGLWNATPRVRSIGQRIPLFKSLNYNEVIDVATGVTAGSGNNATGACAVGPKPGQLKGARITSPFGIIHESSKIVDLTQAGMVRNYGDQTEREFFNAMMTNNPWLPQVPGIEGLNTFSSLLRSEMLTLGIDLERNIGQANILGVSGTSDNAYRGIATQWNGLDRLVRSGWTDVDGYAATALDAITLNFSANIDGGTDSLSRTIVAALIDTYFGQQDFLRGKLGIAAEFAIVMRPDLFRALAAIWSCQFATTRCSTANNSALRVEAAYTQALYQDMIDNVYLPMEGENVQVILDDTIPRYTLGNGYYKSKIYGLMLRGNGRPTVYGQFFDMSNPVATELAGFMPGQISETVNNGMYRVFRYQTGACMEFDFYGRVRLITDAPFAHFSMDNMFYRSSYDQHDAIPGQSFYHNGGTTYRL